MSGGAQARNPWNLRRPGLTLALAAVVGVIALSGTLRLEPDASLGSLLSGDDPTARALRTILEDFSPVEDALVLVSLPEDTEASAAGVARLVAFAEGFAAAARADPAYPELVADLSFRAAVDLASAGEASAEGTSDAAAFVRQEVAPALLYYLDDEARDQLAERLSPSGMAAQLRRAEARLAAPGPGAALAQTVARDPLQLSSFLTGALAGLRPPLETWRGGPDFVSPDGRRMLIRIAGQQPATDIDFTRRLVAALDRWAQAAMEVDRDARPGAALEVATSGAYALADLGEREIRGDMIVSITASMILLQVLFLFAYRGVWTFAVAFVPTALGILAGFALFSLVTRSLTPVTAVIGAILAGLSIDYSIHFLSHFQTRRGDGASPRQAAGLGNGLGRALLAACGTSVVAFSAVGASSLPALRDFAVLGLLGLGCAFLATLTVLPALLVTLEGWFSRRGGSRAEGRGSLLPFVGWLQRRRKGSLSVATAAVLILAATVAVAAAGGGAGAFFASDVDGMHPRPNPPLEAQKALAESFGSGEESLLVLLEAETSEQLVASAHAAQAALGAPELAALGVQTPFGPAALLPPPERRGAVERWASAQREDAAADGGLGERFRSAVAGSAFAEGAFSGYGETLEALLRPVSPPGLEDLARYPPLARSLLPLRKAPEEEGSEEGATALTVVPLARPYADLEQRDRLISSVRRALADVPGATVTGVSVVGSELQRLLQRDLGRLLGIAAVVVALWLGLILRSVRDVALAMLPAAVAILAVLAVIGVTGAAFDPVSMVALPLLAGVGVDDGVFLVSFSRRRAGAGTGGAALKSLAASAHAITMTSLTTVLAFGSLLLTDTPAIRGLGLVLAVGISAAWGASMFVLVPILNRGTPAARSSG